MYVEMGNAQGHQDLGDGNGYTPFDHGEPAVYRWSCPDDVMTHEDGADVNELMRHMLTNSDVTHLPGHEAFVSIVRDWPHHSSQPPTWVASDNDDLERVLSEFFDCPRGRPDDLEETHYTLNGPPGVGPGTASDATVISDSDVGDLDSVLDTPTEG